MFRLFALLFFNFLLFLFLLPGSKFFYPGILLLFKKFLFCLYAFFFIGFYLALFFLLCKVFLFLRFLLALRSASARARSSTTCRDTSSAVRRRSKLRA